MVTIHRGKQGTFKVTRRHYYTAAGKSKNTHLYMVKSKGRVKGLRNKRTGRFYKYGSYSNRFGHDGGASYHA